MFVRYHNRIKILAILLFAVVSVYASAAQDAILPVGSFSKGKLEGWTPKEFKGKTTYTLTAVDNIKALKAESNAAASGLFLEQKIDLEKTPVMNWRWRVEQPLSKLDEQSKVGDDFAARVYVVKSGGLVFWDTKAINYVWSSNPGKSKPWPNPFAGDHAMMVAVRSSEDKAGTWFSEKRNIRKDFKQLIGEDIKTIDAVAIMTDTDNSKGKAAAYYGDIYFTAE